MENTFTKHQIRAIRHEAQKICSSSECTSCPFRKLPIDKPGCGLVAAFETKNFQAVLDAADIPTPPRFDLRLRVSILKAMNLIASQINDECVLEGWLMNGPDLQGDETNEDLEWDCEDERFADYMACFLRVMARAYKSGGLFCDEVVDSNEHKNEE